ncbi:hypothetical protein ACFY7Y_09880 [Streptomyces virginiae]|uniref:hypothetical protein n=1 Tax=Streptomyces virginiae TaxID=1961 RepID=UPI0036B2DC76
MNPAPRLAEASPDITLACTTAGGGLAVAGCLVLGVAALRGARRTPAAAAASSSAHTGRKRSRK